jgi:hypothetical protein
MAILFKALVEQYKFDENKVLNILKAAQIIDSKDTVEKIRDREFSEESIENGFKVILDYFKSSIVPQDDFKKAEAIFKTHQSEKAKVGKQAVADAKTQAASAQENGAITTKDVRPLPALVGKDGVIISEIPIDGETTELWIDYRDKKAADLADSISEAPFRAIDQAADEVDPDAVGLGWRGSLFGKLNEELNDPRRVQYLREKYFGKKPQK